MKKITLLFLILPFLGLSQVQIGDDIDGEADNDFSGSSVSLSSDGSIVAIGAPMNSGNSFNSGHVRIYENQNGAWVQIGQDIDGEVGNDFSGSSVSLSSDGSIVAIGAPNNSGNAPFSGHVRIYENQNGTWVQIGQDIDGEALLDESGSSVSLSSDGNIIAIGAPKNNGNNGVDSGHVRIYENQNGAWVQIGQDIDGEALGDQSGSSVSLSSDGNIVAIGANLNNGNNGVDSGHVRIYENQNGTWMQIGQDIDGEATSDESGISISLSSHGSIVAIGAFRNDDNGSDSGHVRIYENQNGTWMQIGQDIDGEATSDESGISISLSSNGSIVVIGAFGNDDNGSNSGHVRIYENQNGTWIQIGQDINGEALADQSGISISLSSNGSIVAIGAVGNDDNGSNSGHVKIYDLTSVLSTEEPIVNTSKLSSGIYIVEIKTNKGKTSKKLVIE
ncbi:T9SS type A sorting domain-containing protein [uncultured Psychroserpens sp.]|uniref:T9SS type A sorting domain-containing protein n=1 Tax=uncultured Psychroserpens sp. TaxID=255436 RepID=UPI002607D6E1|nr:T9SS type A sorting domain-containing protein [uncultured Psychroserpens sp.]